MFEPDGPKRLCDFLTGDGTWLYFYGIPKKQSNQMRVAADGKRPVVLRPGFQSLHSPVMVDILPQKSTLTATYYNIELFYWE